MIVPYNPCLFLFFTGKSIDNNNKDVATQTDFSNDSVLVLGKPLIAGKSAIRISQL